MKGNSRKLTENEKRLIDAAREADLGIDLTLALIDGLSEEQMPIMTEYIRRKTKEGIKITENDAIRALLILRGAIEVEEE